MEVIFSTGKSRGAILLALLGGMLFPALFAMFILGLYDGFSVEYWMYIPLIIALCMLFVFLKSVIVFRYYIQEIGVEGNALTIRYLYFFREKNTTLEKSEIYFRRNDFRGKYKSFEILRNDRIVISQAPLLEWKENINVQEILADKGFLFKSYW